MILNAFKQSFKGNLLQCTIISPELERSIAKRSTLKLFQTGVRVHRGRLQVLMHRSKNIKLIKTVQTNITNLIYILKTPTELTFKIYCFAKL